MGNDLSIYSSANDDFAEVRQQDVIMPRLMLQQSNSPGVQDGKYKMGDIVDSQQETPAIATGASGSIVPLMFWLEWIEWNPDRTAPKDKKVLARSLDPASELASMAARYVEVDTPQGKRLRVTEYYHFITLMPSWSGNYSDCFMLSFAKSSHKVGKTFLNKLMKAKIKVGDSLIKAPIWAHQWELSAKKEEKDGNRFAVMSVGNGVLIPTEMHASVHELSEGFKARRKEMADKHSEATSNDAEAEADAATSGQSKF